MRKMALLITCALFVLACDPIATAGIAVEPRVDGSLQSTSDSAFALATRVAERHGAAPLDPRKEGLVGWTRCLSGGKLRAVRQAL